MVVGAGPGIGRSCALRFADDGADVVVAARRAEPLAELATEVAELTGRRVVPIVADLADLASCRSLIADTVAELGRVDALVNVATYGGGRAAVADIDLDEYRRAFEVNVAGTLEVARAAATQMAAQGSGGSIVAISTLAVHVRQQKMTVYSSTKLAANQAMFIMAKELGPEGVRVNVVTPGYTTGPNLDAMFASIAERTGRPLDEVVAHAASTAALRRHVDPDDIANAVAFLSSDQARNITGVEIPVDAGQLLGT